MQCFCIRAERLGVLHGRALRALESALTELHWSTFETGCGCMLTRFSKPGSGRRQHQRKVRGAGLQEEGSKVEPEGEGSAGEGSASEGAPSDDDKQGEMADYIRESFIWCWRRATRPPRPLSEDYHVLCPRFSLPEAEGAAADFELPEMVQATFYAMLLNEAIELGVVHGFIAEGLRSALVGLRWSSFEAVAREVRIPSYRAMWRGQGGLLLPQGLYLLGHWSPLFIKEEQAAEYVGDHFRWSLRDPWALGPRPLPSDYHNLCRRFDLGVATRYAHDSNTPEMVQIIFYAMVIDDAAELALSRRLTMDCASRPVDPPTNPVLASNPSWERTTSFPSFRDTVQRRSMLVQPSLVREGNIKPSSELAPLHFTTYYPEFDHIVVMQFAHATYMPEMVQAIFYAVVINDVAKLRLIRRDTEESLALDL
ncbi:hypothetical protein Cgig2_033915 [Carnegiea gigantea]|uniref:Uncharacterized protein n=1 Tax=Carnegiea gigantea TaxID=171969 RepID=A0A9Q1Q6C6_9CARY|nr:hypothetical protein Cgig2_033915 [Carnegiea gigantea]